MDDPYSEYDSETENDVAYKTLPHGKTYHAFISYRDVDEDREWVSDLIEKLKKLHQLKCCNHVYHFKPGRKIVDNIKYAVRKSVKTLIILSKEYNDSHWCTFEVEYTHHMSMEMREQLIIPVLKEDCEIPDHLKPFTYIDARGPIGSWLPRLATSIESPVLCGLESKYSQVDFSTHYRNFDTVHEERSKIGWCRELPFKSRRYIPDSLNDKAFNINNTLYKGVLRAISRSSFFVCRQCVFPWFPIICCWFILVGLGISMFAYFCRSYVFLTHIRSDGKVMAELKLKVQKQNVTEEKWIHDHVSHSIEMMAKSWFYIILVVAWLTCCLVFFLKKRKLMYNALMISNQRLIDHNLLVGFKHYKCLATIKDYLEQCIKKLHVDPSQSDDECCTQHESPPCSQVNDSTDDAIIPLLGNEVMANHIEKSDREKAGDILIRISVDFVLDFLEQKLENSESYRHTSRAVCMCEYAETHGFLPVPVNESGNSERGFRNRSGGATNDFSNVV